MRRNCVWLRRRLGCALKVVVSDSGKLICENVVNGDESASRVSSPEMYASKAKEKMVW